MKVKRSVLALTIAVLLCTSTVLGVSAAFDATASTPAGIYGTLLGNVASVPDGCFLATTTTITKNPDNALLKIDADFSDGSDIIYSHTGSSSRGVTNYSRDLPIYSSGVNSTYVVAVFTAHCVQNGTGTEAYACYGCTEIEWE